jgi:hypothetical protein
MKIVVDGVSCLALKEFLVQLPAEGRSPEVDPTGTQLTRSAPARIGGMESAEQFRLKTELVVRTPCGCPPPCQSASNFAPDPL